MLGENDKNDFKEQRSLTDEEIKVTNSVISNVEKLIEQTKSTSMEKKEIRECAKSIIEEVYKLEDFPITLEQLEKLNLLMSSSTLQGLKLYRSDRIDFWIANTRKMIINKTIKAIDIAQSQTEDLEELISLQKKITPEMTKMSLEIMASTLKFKIYNKITKLKQQQVIHRMKNDISANIQSIINDLANGTLDIRQANKIINEEAEKRVKNEPRTKFSLTQEQQRRQILIQIKTALVEKPEKYKILSPKKTIKETQKLFGNGIEQAVRIVVMNLVATKEFETAKKICNNYSDAEGHVYENIEILKKEVRNAEIGDMVLKGINMNGTIEEENKYFQLIEKGLKRGNVKLASVHLGKSKDGLRNITLADIWIEEKQPRKTHREY